jgi:hypothetical protein
MIHCWDSALFIDQSIIECDMLKCFISDHVMNNPYIDPCGHTMCLECFKEYLRIHLHCPISRLPVEISQLKPNKVVNYIISQLQVKCPNMEDSCTWIEKLSELSSHLKNCNEAKIVCPNGCFALIKRKKLNDHLELCPNKKFRCSKCLSTIPQSKLEKHIKEGCRSEKQNCTLGCGLMIVSTDHKRHIKNDCLNRIKKCKFSVLDCGYVGSFPELKIHYSEEIHFHAKLLSRYLTNTGKSIRMSLEDIYEIFENPSIALEMIIDSYAKYNSTLGSGLQAISYIRNNKGNSEDGVFVNENPSVNWAAGCFLRCNKPFESAQITIKKLNFDLPFFSVGVGFVSYQVYSKISKYWDYEMIPSSQIKLVQDSEIKKNSKPQINFSENETLIFYVDWKRATGVVRNLSTQKILTLRLPSEWRLAYPIVVFGSGTSILLDNLLWE